MREEVRKGKKRKMGSTELRNLKDWPSKVRITQSQTKECP